MKLDAFMARRATILHGYDVTVKDLILQLANAEGAIHAGVPRDEKQRILANASEVIKIGDVDMVTATMRGIGWVVLDTLAPLEAALAP
jgi:hypothetical protein